MPETSAPDRSRWARVVHRVIPLGAPLVVAALIRGLLVWGAWDAALLGDEGTYERLMHRWREHGIYVGAWPPGYPWVLKCVQGVFGDGWLHAARVINALASVVSVGLMMALGAHLGGRRTALVAGWFGALLLSSAIWSALLFSEAIFIVIVLGVVLLLAGGLERTERRRRRFVLAGALIGVGCLVRAAGVLVFGGMIGGAALAVLLEARRAGRERWFSGVLAVRAALWLAVPALLVLLPWAQRNGQLMGESAWLSPTGGGAIALGWSGVVVPFERAGLDDEAIWQAPLGGARRWLEAPGPVLPTLDEIAAGGTRSELMRSWVRDVVVEEPGWALRSRALYMSEMFSPVSFLNRAERLGQLDGLPGPRWLGPVLGVLGVLGSLLLLVLATWSVVGARAQAWWWCVLGGTALAHALIPLLMFGISRFRAPLEPLLVVAAALAVTTTGTRGRRRWVVGGVIGCGLGLCMLIALPVVWTVVVEGFAS